MALPITQTIHYAPKVPPETNCICFYQQLPICCCEDWINAGAETADLVAVTEAANVANANAAAIAGSGTSPPSPTPALPLYAAPGPYFFPHLLFDAASAGHHQQSPLQHHNSPHPYHQQQLHQHHHHHQQQQLHDDPEPLSPWSPPAFHASSPDDGSAEFSSSGGSPAGAASLAESPGNYALSPASSTSASAFGWPAASAAATVAGYGDLYSSSPVSVDTL